MLSREPKQRGKLFMHAYVNHEKNFACHNSCGNEYLYKMNKGVLNLYVDGYFNYT